MSRDVAKVLRQDRAKEDEWIGAYLGAASFGFLATVDDGQPFLNSNSPLMTGDTSPLFRVPSPSENLRSSPT